MTGMVIERKEMKDIENDAIQFFEDQKIRVAWDEQQEKLKQAVLWLHRRTPMFFDSRSRTL